MDAAKIAETAMGPCTTEVGAVTVSISRLFRVEIRAAAIRPHAEELFRRQV